MAAQAGILLYFSHDTQNTSLENLLGITGKQKNN
jgi:hypothetical protein